MKTSENKINPYSSAEIHPQYFLADHCLPATDLQEASYTQLVGFEG